ncbi:DUF4920 domain-containing protein [bacterium SCSIO 12741]|nr:DUF4920 domain-containing protein [bacterium SCSIO 12741]
MKTMRITGLLLLVVLFWNCSGNQQAEQEATTTPETQTETATAEPTPASFGEEIVIDQVTAGGDLMSQLAEMDTVEDVLISGKINSCCQKKGCWMKVDLGDDQEIFVKFKDYGFFVPLDSEGSTALMQGRAYKKTVPVEELRHYAEDAGKSEEEIAAITEPEVSYLFMANGVLLSDYTPSKSETESSEGEETEMGSEETEMEGNTETTTAE